MHKLPELNKESKQVLQEAILNIVPSLLDLDVGCIKEALIKLYLLSMEFKKLIHEDTLLRDIIRSTACLEYRIDTRVHVRVPRARARAR